MATDSKCCKVTVLGAAGGIGQPLSLLLKLNPLVKELRLYDVGGAPGVAADLSHIDTSSKVGGYALPNDGLKKALEGADVVVVLAGVPRKPGMTRDDLFNTNASIVSYLAKATAQHCHNAMLCVISNPVNLMVPVAAEVYKKAGVYDPKRLFGVTTLDLVRARRFASELVSSNPEEITVPVIGGHSGVTIVPLLSQAGGKVSELPGNKPDGVQKRDDLINRIQFAGDEVVKAKDSAGSATLSVAHAGEKFVNSILRALHGDKGVTAYAFVDSPLYKDKGIDYFSSNLTLDSNGVEKIHPIGKVNEYEQKLIEACLSDLKGNIKKGVEFIKNPAEKFEAQQLRAKAQ